MTHGTIAGLLLTDLIMGRPNEWESLYDPSRITLKAAPTFASENLNVAAQFVSYVTPGDVDEVQEIGRGMGAIVRRGLNKIAAYRDRNGIVHNSLPRVPILAILCSGIPPKTLGIVPATVRDLSR